MDLLTISATAIGRLALAETFNGPALARVAPRPANGGESSKREDQVLKAGWRWPEALLNAVVAAGWLIERKLLRGQQLDKDAKAVVTVKGLLVAGAVATSLASLIGGEVLKRAYPEGVRLTVQGELSPEAPAGTDTFQRYFRLMGILNRAFVAGAAAATPFINFALFNDYRPHPIRHLFTL